MSTRVSHPISTLGLILESRDDVIQILFSIDIAMNIYFLLNICSRWQSKIRIFRVFLYYK